MSNSVNTMVPVQKLNAEFANNTAPRIPAILCVDVSGSMSPHINKLNEGIKELYKGLYSNTKTKYGINLAIITFGGTPTDGINVIKELGGIIDDQGNLLDAPEITDAYGQTPLGTAVDMALKGLEKIKEMYRNTNIRYYQPYLFIMSDGVSVGEPIQVLENAKRTIQQLGQDNKLTSFTFYIGDPNSQEADEARNTLRELSTNNKVNESYNCNELGELFTFISQSISTNQRK